MREVVLLDTSIYLNVLDVPNFNQSRGLVFGEFEKLLRSNAHLLLPLALVWETGNHISKLANGQQRRTIAERLRVDVTKAFEGDSPYRPTYFPERKDFLGWLRDFPDAAMRNKSASKSNEGMSLADHSIVQEWSRSCQQNPHLRVRIWSLDVDLQSYDHSP